MATNQGLKQDRAKVAGEQKHEVGFEAEKTGAKPSVIRRVIKKVGNSRARVEAELEKAKPKSRT